MTTNTPDRDLVTKWLLALLKADPYAYPVGDHKAPSGISYPYWVVFSIPGGSISGPPFGAAQADASFVYQVDSIGQTREQVEKLASRGRERVSSRLPNGSYVVAAESPDGLSVLDRIIDGSPGAPIVEGSYPNEIYTISERYAISVTISV